MTIITHIKRTFRFLEILFIAMIATGAEKRPETDYANVNVKVFKKDAQNLTLKLLQHLILKKEREIYRIEMCDIFNFSI